MFEPNLLLLGDECEGGFEYGPPAELGGFWGLLN
jgi:hypothetical protein